MNRLRLFTLLLAAGVALFAAREQPHLTPVGSGYDNGLDDDFAEIISVREKDNLGAITIPVATSDKSGSYSGSIDLLDLSNPSAITRIRRINIPASYGDPTSVAIHPSRDYFLVVAGKAGQTGNVIAYRISDGVELDKRAVGTQPDSVAISHNGNYAVIANEAEGIEGTSDKGGDGSISVIELQNFHPQKPSALHVFQVDLVSAMGVPGFSTGRTDDLARQAIDNSPATLEPESIAFSQNGLLAYITLQENNGVAILDLKTRVVSYLGLGTVTHDADITNGGGYVPVANGVNNAFREPDGIGLFMGKGGVEYFATADEGDTRNGTGGAGVRGGRTVSIFNAKTGALVGHTGRQIDDAAAAAGLYPDDRSNRGGSEPEVLDVAQYNGRDLVAVGLERARGVALIDVSEPSSPVVIDVKQSGNRPEGVKFLKVRGGLYVLVANEEGSPSVAALRVE